MKSLLIYVFGIHLVSEYKKYSYRENVFLKKLYFLKTNIQREMSHMSNRYDNFNINLTTIRCLIDDHFLFDN